MIASGDDWLAICLAAIILFGLRYGGFAMMQKVRVTPRLEVFLERMSISVLVAIVASALATGGFRTITAVALGVLVMLATRSPILAMLAGVGAGAFWTGLLA